MTEYIDLDKARRETLGCTSKIHFNNAGCALMPRPVSQALHEFLQWEEQKGGYEVASAHENTLNRFYTSVADLIGCSSQEIACIENATRAWDMAFYSLKFSPGDKILSARSEYGSNIIAFIQQAERYGVEVVYVPNDEHGQIDVQQLENLVDSKVKLISVAHIPTGGGLVNPAAAVGRIAKAAGIPYILDACQAVGQIALDVEEIGCDMLCGTGRKYLRGPRGTGFLYVRKSLIESLEPPMLDQHSAQLLSPTQYKIRDDAKRFENWEHFVAGKYALTKAVDYALEWGMKNIQQRIYYLANQLRQKLSLVNKTIVTDEGVEKCGIVTFCVAGKNPVDIKTALAQQNINISISKWEGNAASFQQRNLHSVLRASLHYYNTEKEIDTFMNALEQFIS